MRKPEYKKVTITKKNINYNGFVGYLEELEKEKRETLAKINQLQTVHKEIENIKKSDKNFVVAVKNDKSYLHDTYKIVKMVTFEAWTNQVGVEAMKAIQFDIICNYFKEKKLTTKNLVDDPETDTIIKSFWDKPRIISTELYVSEDNFKEFLQALDVNFNTTTNGDYIFAFSDKPIFNFIKILRDDIFKEHLENRETFNKLKDDGFNFTALETKYKKCQLITEKELEKNLTKKSKKTYYGAGYNNNHYTQGHMEY